MIFLGNYWDWLVPYFSSGYIQFIQNQLHAWSSISGSPLSYDSSYYFNFFMALLGVLRLNPETIMLAIMILLAVISLFLLIKILINSKVNSTVSVLMIFITVTNTAIFYKLLAGHFNYFISMTLFIGLLYFLFVKFKNNLHSYLILSLMLAFIGVQIQFFIIMSLFLLIYFIFHKDKFNRKYALSLIAIVFLVNLPWLSNFLVGANGLSNASQNATEMLFAGSAFTSLPRIFLMIFSSATNIQYVYDKWTFIFFGVFTLLVYLSVLYYYIKRFSGYKFESENKNNAKRIDTLALGLLVFSFLGTGFFLKIPIPIVKVFYPMFRESGHLAPIIILFEVLLFSFVLPCVISCLRDRTKRLIPAIMFLFSIYLVGFISINAYYFYEYLPMIDYSFAREKFQPFNDFNQQERGSYRILTYPFWQQYGFLDTKDIEKNKKLLNNSGWDSFMAFSGKDLISNYQPGGKGIENTLQYRLLTKKDISELERMNVRYIYDFQKIYVSNWDKYSDPWTYSDNLSLIKNDPGFMDNIIAANPGKIKRVADGIYELNNYLPRVFLQENSEKKQEVLGSAKPRLYFTKENPSKYRVSIKGLKGKEDLVFLENYHKDWELYIEKNKDNTKELVSNFCNGQKDFREISVVECKSFNKTVSSKKELTDSEHRLEYDYANKWSIDLEKIKANGDQFYRQNGDDSIDVDFVIYFKPETPFVILTIIGWFSLVVIAILIVSFVKKGKKRLNDIK